MRVIKDRIITDYPWTMVDDAAVVSVGDGPEGNLIVSLSRYRAEKERLLACLSATGAVLGVSINSDVGIEDIAGELPQLSLLVLNSQLYTDGRCFSQAILLRQQYGFKGDILVIGDMLQDQVRQLERCGANVFCTRDGKDLEDVLPVFSEITVQYQSLVQH